MSYFSEREILDFLDNMARRGMVPKNTAFSQKAAVIKMLSPLTNDEKQKLDENFDLESLYTRFMHLSKGDLNHMSLRAYKSRFKIAMASFLAWKKNPDQFNPKTKIKSIKTNTHPPIHKKEKPFNTPIQTSMPEVYKFIVPIRPGIFAHLELPVSLSKAEANRVNELVVAYTKSLIFEENMT